MGVSTLWSQPQIMLLRQSNEQGFLGIDDAGNHLFELPPGHEPTVRQDRESIRLGNFYKVNLSEGGLPVQYGEHYYLMDIKGNKIADLPDSLNWVSPFQEGYFRAYERYENRRNASWVVYLDKTGKPCFDGQRFWEGSPFVSGVAIVQPDTADDWLLIDLTGHPIANLSDSIPG